MASINKGKYMMDTSPKTRNVLEEHQRQLTDVLILAQLSYKESM